MKWKYVLNLNDNTRASKEKATDICRLTGYKFMYWNWKVWFVTDVGIHHTNIEVEDLI